MSVYRGTEGSDRIDQFSLNLPAWTTIYGQGGDDWITLGVALAVPGAGNDTIVGSDPNSSIAYWDALAPVHVDLQLGFAEDGLGGRDRIDGVRIVHDGGFNDTLLGSANSDRFWLSGGDNFVDGRGGLDVVRYFATSDQFLLRKTDASGVEVVRLATGQIDRLQNVETVEFNDRTVIALDTMALTVTHVFSQGGFAQQGLMVFAGAADLDADGRTDLVIAPGVAPPSPVMAAAPFVLLQGRSGEFTRNDSFIAGPRHGLVHPREMAFADLNADSRLDVVIVGHGYDAAPAPGERSSLLLSASGGLVDASSNLPAANAFTHSVAIGDANADGAPDVFLGNINGQELVSPRLLLNSGDGRFTRDGALPAVLELGRPSTLVFTSSLLVDLNGDGRLELVLGNDGSAASVVLSQDASGRFSDAGLRSLPPGRFGAQGSIVIDVIATDLNRDGLLDLLLSQTRADPSYVGRAIQALVQTTDGGFVDETEARFPRFDTAQAWLSFLTTVDVNRDGHPDLIATGTDTQSSNVYVNDGLGRFTAAGPEAGFPAIAAGFLMPGVSGELYNVYSAGGGVISVDRIDPTANLGTGPSGTATAAAGAPGFNEGYYRNENPDVVALVTQGAYSSGLAHYLAQGRTEGRHAFAPHTMVWGSERDDLIVLREGNEMAQAGGGNDQIWAGLGDDVVNGGLGLDSVHIGSSRSAVRVAVAQDGTVIVSGPAGNDNFLAVERLVFSDGVLAFDINGNAGQAYRLYQAAFARTPDTPGLKYQTNALDTALNLWQVAGNFIASPEFQSLYGSPATVSDARFVTLLYNNVLGRAPEQAGYDYHMTNLAAGLTRAQLLTQFSESPENQRNVLPAIQDGIWMG